MEKKWIISYLMCLLVILGIGIVISYSSYGDPAEFGNITTTTCWIGGDFGELNCTGNTNIDGSVTATNFYGIFHGNSSIWSRAGTFIFPTNIGDRVGIGTTGPVSLTEISGPSPYLTLSNSSVSVLIDNALGVLNFYSHDSSTTSKGGVGQIRVAAETAYNTGGTPSYMAFYTHDGTANDETVLGDVTEQMRITSAGKIGIGTTSPSDELEVSGANARINLNSTTDSGYHNSIFQANSVTSTRAAGMLMSNDGSNKKFFAGVPYNSNLAWGVFYINSATETDIYQAPANLLTVRDDGNVGIGTVSPNSKLHINNSADAAIYTTWESTSATQAKEFRWWINDKRLFLVDETNSATRLAILDNGNVGIGTTSPNSLLETGKVADTNEVNLSGVVYVNSTSGNVGIGTATPDYPLTFKVTDDVIKITDNTNDTTFKLTAEGGLRFDSSVLTATTLYGFGVGMDPVYAFDVNGTTRSTNFRATGIHSYSTAGYGSMQMGIAGQGVRVYRSRAGVGYGFEVDLTDAGATGNILQLKNNAGIVMVVTQAGNVGIGTTGPGYKLEVNGGLNVSNDLFVNHTSGNVGVGVGLTNPLSSLAVGGVGHASYGISSEGATGGVAIYGKDTAAGIGVEGWSVSLSDGTGVKGTGKEYGVHGYSYSVDGIGGFFESTQGPALVTGTGNVGIGTASPEYEFHIHKASGGTGIQITKGTQATPDEHMKLFVNSGFGNLAMITEDDLHLSTNNTVRVTIDGTTGNIGIGTTSPDFKLQVNGDIVPETNASFDLGTSALAWDNVYAVTYNDLTPAWLESDGSALDALSQITSKDGEILHESYPIKLRNKFYIIPITSEKCRQIVTGYKNIEVLKNITEEVCEIINETEICEEVIVEKYITENQTIYGEECWDETTQKSIQVDESLSESEQINFVASKLNISELEIKEFKLTRDLGATITAIVESIKQLFDWNTEQDDRITQLENEIISLKAENQIIKLAFCKEFPQSELCGIKIGK